MHRREFSTALIAVATGAVLSRMRAQAHSDAPGFAQTDAELAAGVTPTDTSAPLGDPRRYGALLDGAADDTTALRNWARVGGQLTFPAARTALISAAIPLSSQTTISAGPGATLATATTDTSIFTASSGSNIHIAGLSFVQTAAGSKAYVAHVNLNACTNCIIEGCSFQGCQWAGVYLQNGCTYCVVRSNSFRGFLGSIPNQADVCVFQSSSNNVIEGNTMYGGGEHGIICLSPHVAGPFLPSKNLLANNRIGQHTGYGIAVYMPGWSAAFSAEIAGAVLTVSSVSEGSLAVGQFLRSPASGAPYGYIISLGSGTGGSGTYNLSQSSSVADGTPVVATAPIDTFNEVSGNYIENIQGTFSTNRSSGAGIYVVGAAAGATRVIGNTIANCCVQTKDRNLAPAGIGISNTLVGCTGAYVANNTVTGMTQGDGILVVACQGGCDVLANKVELPESNNGGGPGGASLLGTGIRIDDSNSVVCRDNDATVLGTGSAIFIYANGVSIADITVSGGHYESASAVTFRVDTAKSRAISNLNVSGVRARNARAGSQSFSVESASSASGGGPAACSGSGRGAAAATISNCVGLRVVGGS
jgi:parallel beta-helix repeat protein